MATTHDEQTEDEHVGDEPSPDEVADGSTLDGVRGVLREIGAEGALAQVEARLEGLEAELALAEQRAAEAVRARRGELEVMRARIEDALAVVTDATTEQRSRVAGIEERLAARVEEAEAGGRELVASLREDLTPRVQQAVHRVDEAVAELRGELTTDVEELAADLTRQRDEHGEVSGRLDRAIEELRDGVRAEAAARADALDQLRARLVERLDELVATGSRDRDTAAAGREALRRELDAAVGELRATLSLRVQETTDRIELLEQELGAEKEARTDRLVEVEDRWMAVLREVVERSERGAVAAREVVAEERVARAAAVDEVAVRLAEVAAELGELGARVDGDAARRGGELDRATHATEETARRLETLQAKVASVVRQMATELSNRVATVAADLDTVRTAGVETRERLAAVDQLEERIASLERTAREPAPAAAPAVPVERVDRVEEALADLRRQLGTVTGQLAESQARARELGNAIAELVTAAQGQAALRQDVRDLTVRSSELATRLQATESLARATGQAVATAVRRARGETSLQPQAPDVPLDAPLDAPPDDGVGPAGA
ncbi:MAG: hypothetical protein ACLGIR_13265 [Actinomycetes bacterium]